MQGNTCVTMFLVQFDCAFLSEKMFKISPDKWLLEESKLEHLRLIFQSWTDGQSVSKEYVCKIWFSPHLRGLNLRFLYPIFLVCQCLPRFWSARRLQFFFFSVWHFPGEFERWARPVWRATLYNLYREWYTEWQGGSAQSCNCLCFMPFNSLSSCPLFIIPPSRRF